MVLVPLMVVVRFAPDMVQNGPAMIWAVAAFGPFLVGLAIILRWLNEVRLLSPVLQFETGNLFKVDRVSSGKNHPLCDRNRSNSKIHRRDANLLSFNVIKDFRSRKGIRQHLRFRKIAKNLFQSQVANHNF